MPRAIGAGRSTTASGLHRPFSDPAAVDGVASWPPIGTLASGLSIWNSFASYRHTVPLRSEPRWTKVQPDGSYGR
jgi:hypothetical protein